MAALLLIVMKILIKNPKLYEAPDASHPPPGWIRALLMFTCTGVSFAHGSNDGQKGMGLIMLILVGILPTTYALKSESTESELLALRQQLKACVSYCTNQEKGADPDYVKDDPANVITTFLRGHHSTSPELFWSVKTIASRSLQQLGDIKSLSQVPEQDRGSLRADLLSLIHI